MFRIEEPPVTCKVATVSLLTAMLFAAGASVSIFAVFLARISTRGHLGEGFVFLAAVSLRVIALLVGCVLVYAFVANERAESIAAVSMGIAAGWLAHTVYALWVLKK